MSRQASPGNVEFSVDTKWDNGGDRAESVVSTEGYEVEKSKKAKGKSKVKKHKTKPTTTKERKSRKKGSKSRDGGGGSAGGNGDGDRKWAPDPNSLTDEEWEQALEKFFRE